MIFAGDWDIVISWFSKLESSNCKCTISDLIDISETDVQCKRCSMFTPATIAVVVPFTTLVETGVLVLVMHY